MNPRETPAPQRLNQILSLAGLTSRRHADAWIEAGRVTVNDKVVKALGTRAVWGVDRICVDGREVPRPFERVYIMLNKPFGYMCTLNDPQGRPIVSDLLRDIPGRLYPVGRLDFDTMGLLLMTNDGPWANRITHPRYKVPRIYKVSVAGSISDDALDTLGEGVRLSDGPTGRSKITLLHRNAGQSTFRMTIWKGKPRQVRRMAEAVGHRVIHLIRIGYGPLELGNLKVGEYRHLTPEEVKSLKK
jgi:23S rRNA pseudouridine2605 synthase